MTCTTCNKDKPLYRDTGQCRRCYDTQLPYHQAALTGGRWRPDGRGIMRWVPDAKPVVVGGRVVGVAS